MNSKDYYSLLKIDRNATENDIKKAYKKLAMEFHPDVNTEENAEEKFKVISEAYAVLKDNQKRQLYDQTGSTDFNGFGSMVNRQGRGQGRGMGRCMGRGMGMGKCSGIDALFQKRSRYSKRRPATPGVIPE
ncbi:DnaJ domain-containing protein [Desulfobacula phenolica]|uniref:Molecular chaperone DnaJ n=1 Tax=Desulfobacula phenolica TaxID=90732 RepID=A0A1H2IT58_9BACT|nr:DnaJ domain-containing protein [Desulfobacula phenolica]SDU47329.1 molecular chaperone DnaJ [Desulfobacula phenolica]